MYFLEAIVRPPFPLKGGWHVATFCPVSVTFMVEESHDLIASESKGDCIQQPENRAHENHGVQLPAMWSLQAGLKPAATDGIARLVQPASHVYHNTGAGSAAGEHLHFRSAVSLGCSRCWSVHSVGTTRAAALRH